MLFTESTGRKVVSTSTADTVANVGAFLVDPVTRTVAGIQLKKSKSGDALAWSGITAFGADAVTVESADKIIDTGSNESLAALDGKAHAVLGKRVLTTDGDDLGTVDDIDFDPETGSISFLIVKAEKIDGSTLIGVGSYAVVLSHRDR